MTRACFQSIGTLPGSKDCWKMHFSIIAESIGAKARFKRRILHVPNQMQMSEHNRFFSFALDSAHVKCDV